jgi:hypothetical protein
MAYLLLEITLPSHQLQNRQGLLSTTNSLTHKTPIQRVKFNGIQLITLCNRGERPLDSAFYAKAPRLGCSSGSDGQTLRAPRHRVRHPSPALCQPRLRQNLQLQKHLPIAAVCPMRAVRSMTLRPPPMSTKNRSLCHIPLSKKLCWNIVRSVSHVAGEDALC